MEFPELAACCICPRNCGVNRYQQSGYCGASAELRVNLATLHHGEEPPLSGNRGSGTIFFSWCNLRCVYCQNYNISTYGWGNYYSGEELAKLMLQFQDKGAHNINLVTPTHYSLHLIAAVELARKLGLTLPIVWNSSAYELVPVLKRLHGLVDIFLPDYKYTHGAYSKKYSHAADYPAVALEALREMYAQVGNLEIGASGIATKGMLVRIMVLPNGFSGARKALDILADNFGTQQYISLMAQYYPAGKANQYPELNRGLNTQEYQEVIDTAWELGFRNVYTQDPACSDVWTPEFVNPSVDAGTDKLSVSIHNPTENNK